jgi:hypothetical protein
MFKNYPNSNKDSKSNITLKPEQNNNNISNSSKNVVFSKRNPFLNVNSKAASILNQKKKNHSLCSSEIKNISNNTEIKEEEEEGIGGTTENKNILNIENNAPRRTSIFDYVNNDDLNIINNNNNNTNNYNLESLFFRSTRHQSSPSTLMRYDRSADNFLPSSILAQQKQSSSTLPIQIQISHASDDDQLNSYNGNYTTIKILRFIYPKLLLSTPGVN